MGRRGKTKRLSKNQSSTSFKNIEKDDNEKKVINDCFSSPSNDKYINDVDYDTDSSTDDEISLASDPLPYIVGMALQVLSIAIFKPDDDNHRDSHIRGEITITDHNMKKKYYIYQGDRKDKLVPGWNDLLLTRGPVASVMGGNIEFELTSEHGNVGIFNHKYDMNKATENSEKRTFTLEGDGNCGYRCNMLFMKTPFAAIAKVAKMFLLSPLRPSTGKDYYEIHGKISVNTIVCFETKREGALKGRYRTGGDLEWLTKPKTSFPFHNTVYVVPLDSPLTVDVELYCDGLVITKRRFERKLSDGMTYPFFECEAGGFVFKMEVHWTTPYHFFDGNVQLVSEPTGPYLTKYFCAPESGALVEVFSVLLDSVFLGGGNSAAPCHIDLCGAIIIRDGDKKFNMLRGKKDCPGKLLSSENDVQQLRTLPLKWPNGWWIDGENFGMHFKLKDGKNNSISVGLNSWLAGNDARYDIRLCDVFEGVNGYLVAMHYSVFKRGKKAKVYVECSNGPYSIYGSVFAEYNNYEYSSTYEKQCYRSMLFKRSEDIPLLAKHLQIPLLKSQVSAPSDCDDLIVCVDLWVRPLGASIPHQRFTFNTSETKCCDMIWGHIRVKVEWISG